jgi:hypothetical protein
LNLDSRLSLLEKDSLLCGENLLFVIWVEYCIPTRKSKHLSDLIFLSIGNPAHPNRMQAGKKKNPASLFHPPI